MGGERIIYNEVMRGIHGEYKEHDMQSISKTRALSARQIANLCKSARLARLILANDEWVSNGRFAIKHKGLHDAVAPLLAYAHLVEVTDRTRITARNMFAAIVPAICTATPCEPPDNAVAKTIRKYLPNAECRQSELAYYWHIGNEGVAVVVKEENDAPSS